MAADATVARIMGNASGRKTLQMAARQIHKKTAHLGEQQCQVRGSFLFPSSRGGRIGQGDEEYHLEPVFPPRDLHDTAGIFCNALHDGKAVAVAFCPHRLLFIWSPAVCKANVAKTAFDV